MRDDLIKTLQIANARCYVALQCSFVPKSPSRGMKVVRWQSSGCRGTLVSIPVIKDCFLCVAGHRACLVERAVCGGGCRDLRGCSDLEQPENREMTAPRILMPWLLAACIRMVTGIRSS